MLNETLISYAILLFYLGERLIELLVNRLNYQFLITQTQVVKRYPFESMQMKLFHSCWFVSLFFEMNLHGKLLSGAALMFSVFILFLAQLLRWWAILSLGHYWSIDIYEMKKHPIIIRGPYHFIKHPNYIAVMAEFVFLPLLLGCPYTLFAGTLFNTFILQRRIHLEENALEEQSNQTYSEVFRIKH